ncbi:unnamed protein product, partial [Polarella glacialis]
MLATSQRHNDMVLCCTASDDREGHPRAVLPSPPTSPPKIKEFSSGEKRSPPAGSRLSSQSEEHSPPQSRLATTNEVSPTSLSRGCDELSPQRNDRPELEKENHRLRIENAELKKRLRFGNEFLHKEIRRLRIENAEIKKRLYFPSHAYHVPAGFGTQCSQASPSLPLPLQQYWVPASAVLTPAGAATSRRSCESPAGSAAGGSGQVSPCSPLGARETGSSTPAHGSVTPIPHGFWVPLAGSVMSPSGQPWPPGAMGQWVAISTTRTGPFYQRNHAYGESPTAATTSMSPFSDSSQERLLPKNLLGSDPNSSRVCDPD